MRFCMKIFEKQGFRQLNPEDFLSSDEGMIKQFAGLFPSNKKKALELVRLMDERFADPTISSVSLGDEDESLVKLCPE